MQNRVSTGSSGRTLLAGDTSAPQVPQLPEYLVDLAVAAPTHLFRRRQRVKPYPARLGGQTEASLSTLEQNDYSNVPSQSNAVDAKVPQQASRREPVQVHAAIDASGQP